MADTVRLRNISKQALHVAVMNDALVEPDCVIDIPAALLHHQRACTGVEARFDPDTGTWPEGPCAGCLTWPAETWKVESAPKTTTKSEG